MSIKKEIFKNIEKLPLLTKSALELIRNLQSDDYSISDLSKIIRDDPILVTKILNFVNSSALAKGKQIESVELALSYLGKQNIMKIALNSYSKKIFNKDLEGYECEKGIFRKHIQVTAIASRLIAEKTGNLDIQEQAYIGGILHDVGKIVISRFLKEQRAEFIEELNKHRRKGLEIEENLLGTDHTEIGYRIADYWDLPKIYQEVIHWHHEPKKSDPNFRKICYIVHLGNIVAMLYGTGTPIDALSTKLDQDYEKYLDFKSNDLELILLQINDEYKQLKKMG